jgi:hypothetical protein
MKILGRMVLKFFQKSGGRDMIEVEIQNREKPIH